MINSFIGEYAFLSNFYPAIVIKDGLEYKSVESAYQASKSDNLNIRKCFVNLSPSDAKRLGRTIILRKDWLEIRLCVMYDLVYQKFLNENLKNKIFNTGAEELVEGNTWNDTFWGVCNGIGENRLGKILMDIRTYLKNKE
jgi:ribA/ribD-fused uncharacterized protein